MSTGLHGLLWDESKREVLIEGIRRTLRADLESHLERYGDNAAAQEYRDRTQFFEDLLDGFGKEISEKLQWKEVAAKAVAAKQELSGTVDRLAKQVDELFADAEKEMAEHDEDIDRMQREHVAEIKRLKAEHDAATERARSCHEDEVHRLTALLGWLRHGVTDALGRPAFAFCDKNLVACVAKLKAACGRHDAERRLFMSLFTYAKVDQFRGENVGLSYEQAVASAEATVSHLLRVFHETDADYQARFMKPADPPNPHDF